MEIVKSLSEGKTVLLIKGKLNAATAQDFNTAVEDALEKSNAIVLDFKDVSYLASAGLRVIVAAHKKLNAAGSSLSLLNIQNEVMEVFEITGLDEVLDIRNTNAPAG
jgi:anti-sigma B factor antagonist